ncbi:hypothetical protein HDU77_005699 [Chytriomyces hyalinus]|nr:hypothetical protein HDU77_005699 [Chytriomyces hyalinus]
MKLLHRIVPMTNKDSDVPVFWSRCTLSLCLVVVFLCIVFEAWLMSFEDTIETSLKNDAIRLNLDSLQTTNLQLDLTVTLTYHIVFFISMLFWLFLVWDAVMTFNTLQVISINVFNVAMFVYSVLQLLQIETDKKNTARLFGDDVDVLAYLDPHGFRVARTALPVCTGLFIPVFAYLTVKLKADFGWRKYRIAGGDKNIEQVFIWYHIFLLLQKFSFLFVLSFGAINSILVASVSVEPPAISTTVAVTIMILPFLGHHAARREKKILGYFVVLVYFALIVLCSYTLWFTLHAWQGYTSSDRRNTYVRMLNTLLMYAVVAVLVLIASAVAGAFCVWNYGKGLKDALDKEKLRLRGELQVQEIDLDE